MWYLFFRLKCQIFQHWRHLAIFFISFKIKSDVTFIGFTTEKRIFTTFWYQNCKNCKVVQPITIWIWLKYSWNLLMCRNLEKVYNYHQFLKLATLFRANPVILLLQKVVWFWTTFIIFFSDLQKAARTAQVKEKIDILLSIL